MLDRVQLARRPLRSSTARSSSRTASAASSLTGLTGLGRPPIEKLADFGIKLGHGTAP
jgi:hypothetical protein